MGLGTPGGARVRGPPVSKDPGWLAVARGAVTDGTRCPPACRIFLQPHGKGLLYMISTWHAWRLAKVRLIQWGPAPHYPFHLTFTPRLGFSIPWPGGRLRWAPHHGLQFVRWTGTRWAISKQVLGRSTVRGEPKE